MKYTTELKSSLIQDGQLQEFEKANKLCALGNFEPLTAFKENYGDEVFKCCASLSHSKYRKRKNIETRFTDKIENNRAVFITLTFTDEVLAKTSEKTRRRYVARFLKDQCEEYVANIDYGTKNEREHYHALCMTKNTNNKLDFKKWKYGRINGEKVRVGKSNGIKVSKYVAKLSQHALKKSCRLPRFIWSRNKKTFEEYLDGYLPF